MTESSARPFSASDRPLSLGASDLHLWFCRRGNVRDSDQLKRGILSRYAPVAPCQWRFTEGEFGKPALLAAPRPLDFNLSHSGDWLVCAVTAGVPVGVDIEYCDRRRELMKLAARFFLPCEVAALEALDPEAATGQFYDYWALKEAAIKARGAALGAELEKTGFRLSPGRQAGGPGVIEHSGEVAAGAHYYLLESFPGYRLATCWRGANGVVPQLAQFEWRAEGDVTRQPCSVLAASAI